MVMNFIEEGGPFVWLAALGAAAALALFAKGVLNLILSKLKILARRTHGNWDDVAIFAFEGTKYWAIFIWIAVAIIPVLDLHPSVTKAGHTALILVSALQIAIWGVRAINCWRDDYIRERTTVEPGEDADMSMVAAISLVGTTLQGLIVVVITLFAMSNLGIDVMTLVAGLGIGGVAVALAAQNILGDIFGSLSIVLDKPFVVGDFIAVGEKVGTVENVGLKTTRLRALSGEQLVFANKDLLESRVQNFKRMHERRVVQKFGVVYSTPADKLELIPQWVKALIESDSMLRYDRCHFMNYGDSSLDFEFVFYVLHPEFNVFMDHQQKLLLGIFRKLEAEKIEFAFPTRTLYVPELANQFTRTQVQGAKA